VDESRNNLIRKRNFRSSYGKQVKKYNSRKRNLLNSKGAIPIEDFSRVKHMIDRMQSHFSQLFMREILEAAGSGDYDPLYEGKISIKDTLIFCVMEAYNNKVKDGSFRDMSIGDMKTFNQSVRGTAEYQAFEEMFDLENRSQIDRSKAVLENYDRRTFRETFAEVGGETVRNKIFKVRKNK